MADKYLISESLRTRLKTTIEKVEAMPFRGGGLRIPTAYDDGAPPAPAKTFRICTFTGSWAINTSKTVTFLGVTSTPNTVSVSNVLFSMPDQGSIPCAIAKDGTAWHLVDVRHTFTDVITSVSLSTAGLVFTRTRIQVASTATASSVTIGTTACA